MAALETNNGDAAGTGNSQVALEQQRLSLDGLEVILTYNICVSPQDRNPVQ